MRVDYRLVDFNGLYADNVIADLSREELKEALEKVPCCTTNEDGTKFGDPLNLVIVGNFSDVAGSFVQRGWVPAEETYQRPYGKR